MLNNKIVSKERYIITWVLHQIFIYSDKWLLAKITIPTICDYGAQHVAHTLE